MSSLVLLAATTLGMGAAWSQPPSDVTIHVLARQTCLVGSLDVPCPDVGAKLRDRGISLDANIHVIADKHARYQAVSAALASLRDAGFRLKMGYVNYRE
jgi:biopolymer transport protein ExbD